ncbi:superoxide dismutase family protein [Marinithermus hydrothermalis]|uniref:Superoxide dismutase [Cu-Zn] n=1 Tax=Marinithermus hydrothermalis (strain DSM 14884 / JCM 11576 / T1) TaxID=869210 RepID=F2NQ03_MARHT|nr:superoxide dismutase family protein [Marinithermus hydrothermalis]AEB11104.1 Superoxide dismutase [Marinithermus hydrothermalis DSM 14884]
MNRSIGLLILAVIIAALFLVLRRSPAPNPPAAASPTTTEALAPLAPTSGSSVQGTVRFTQTDQGLRIVAEVSGLEPNTQHGFHIHEVGDCSAPDASSAGGHYNPTASAHGSPDSPEHHAGDLGNLEAGEDGRARYERTMADLALEGGLASVLGLSVVVHANPDDLTTQPSGNAGPRVACGVIEAAEG